MDSSNFMIYEVEINNEDMQLLQDAFCKANDMYMMCMTKKHGPITSFSGTKYEEDFVEQNFSLQLRNDILDAFVDGNVENIVERTGDVDYFMYRGVAIRGKDASLLGVWLCFGVDESLVPEDLFIPKDVKRTSSFAFEKALSFIEILTKHYLEEKLKATDLLQKLSEEQESYRLIEHRLQKNEIMTEILRLMESENSFTKIAEDILRESGKYIGASHVFLLKIAPDEKCCDMISEWVADGAESLISRSQGLDCRNIPFMNGKPYTISSDASLPADFDKYFKENSIEAGIFLPIEVNDTVGMYLCFVSIGQPRKWSVDDLRFTNDVKHILHTILIKRITKNSLASSYDALETILQRAGCGVAVTDVVRRKTLYVNDTFKRMFENEIDKLAVDEILYDTDENLKNVSGYAANGSGRWYNIVYGEMVWVDGRNVRITSFYDISDMKSYQRRMEKQANEDMLTGLLNRQRFERDIEAEYHFVTKTERNFAVLMIDLDDFGNINEGLGHSNGDALLKYIAHSLNGISLITDKCYRVGGDEFAIIVDHEIYDKLDFIIKRVANLFDNPWVIDGQEFYCTMSMGGVRIPEDTPDSDSIVKRLTTALHNAKKAGKNCVEFYDSNVSEEAAANLIKEKALREAVKDNCRSFEVFYQPIVEINKENDPCCGAEALVRWNSIEYGMLEPDSFIEMAESLGLIVQIGEHVLLEACKACKHWNDFGYPEYKVNVNLSVLQLMKGEIVETVRSVLSKTAIEPHNLTLEVTESLAIEDMEKMVEILGDLRAMGCRIALDDFGTGYSSLNHIHKMPLDTIKIDRVFVSGVGKDNFSEAFIKSVAELASALDIDVCCEGIDDEAQLKVLKKYSVNVAQGYLFDMPLTLREFQGRYLS